MENNQNDWVDLSKQRRLTFGEAVNKALQQNYCNFSGRASLSEFWWFYLFQLLCTWAASFVGAFLGDVMEGILSVVVSLALFLPSLGIAFRRLHDTGRGGQWLWIGLVPIVGWIILIYFYVQPSEPTPNRFGPVPNMND